MIEVLSIKKLGKEKPQNFLLVYKESEGEKKPIQTSLFGTEAMIRTALQTAGVSRTEADELFASANFK